MQHLISNSLNTKSVINNILAGSLNKVIILTGVYGTGKTVFATQIARMLTCQNLTQDGYCQECESCKSEIVSGVNSFNNEIHLLNMEKVTYEEMKVLVNQATNKVRSRNEVYVFDEFHLVDKKAQELWLAETAKLEDCYIIMTTTDRRSVSDGILSRAIQIGMKQLAPLEAEQLIRQHYPDASKHTVRSIIKKVGGSPRELINTSQYYSKSGLTEDEIYEHLSNVNQQEIVLCLEALTNRDLFFEALRTVRSMSEYSVRKALQDLLWDWLGSTEVQRKEITYLERFTEKQITRFLVTATEDPFITLLNMFSAVTIKKPISEDLQTLENNKGVVQVQPVEQFKKEEKW